MAQISYPFTLTAGAAENVNQLNSNLTAITDEVNGNLDNTNVASAEAAILGLSQSGSVRRGRSIIATSEARTNTAYGTLTTPDQVSECCTPDRWPDLHRHTRQRGRVCSGAASAAIFIGSNQLKTDARSSVARSGGIAGDHYAPLASID